MKRVVRFGKKGKLSPSYVGPYEILQRVNKDAYELKIPSEWALVHSVFHVSMLKKCIRDPSPFFVLKVSEWMRISPMKRLWWEFLID